jgi:hypothetical protein
MDLPWFYLCTDSSAFSQCETTISFTSPVPICMSNQQLSDAVAMLVTQTGKAPHLHEIHTASELRLGVLFHFCICSTLLTCFCSQIIRVRLEVAHEKRVGRRLIIGPRMISSTVDFAVNEKQCRKCGSTHVFWVKA